MFDSRIEVIDRVLWHGEDRATFHLESQRTWSGAMRKDFWRPDRAWEKQLVHGVKLRLWTVQPSVVVGFEAFLGGDWTRVWCAANNFYSKEDRARSRRDYANYSGASLVRS